MEAQMPDPVPSIMRWRFNQLKRLLKETVTMTPNNGQATVRPGQRIIVDLPFNSTVTWFFHVTISLSFNLPLTKVGPPRILKPCCAVI